MIRSTDTLLHRHFGKGLADEGVEILDPATGTGSYPCDLIEYLPRASLAYKYKHELHANEVAILPSYIANLNIETTYAAKMGSYAPFEHLCFVNKAGQHRGPARGRAGGTRRAHRGEYPPHQKAEQKEDQRRHRQTRQQAT